MLSNPLSRHPVLVVTTALFALSAPLAVLGQAHANAQADSEIAVGALDRNAASEAVDLHHHATHANTEAGKSAARSLLSTPVSAQPQSGAAAASVSSNVFGFFPADLVYSGGPVLHSVESNPIYVNSTSNTGGCKGIEQCWGEPEDFIEDLGRSNFIHLVDQYVGNSKHHHYTLGDHFRVTVPSGTLLESDIVSIVHSVAAKEGAGYRHIYHVFLPPGTDTCFDNGTICYSPDNPNNFYFCAYHSSVTFKDIGHVLFTVEPYQNVPGCRVAPPNPNSQLIDSTNSVLSHELFEAITDPDGTGWWNRTSLDLGGFEIGDECQPFAYNNGAVDPTFRIGEHLYEVQLEYSNTYHACINVP